MMGGDASDQVRASACPAAFLPKRRGEGEGRKEQGKGARGSSRAGGAARGAPGVEARYPHPKRYQKVPKDTKRARELGSPSHLGYEGPQGLEGCRHWDITHAFHCKAAASRAGQAGAWEEQELNSRAEQRQRTAVQQMQQQQQQDIAEH